MPWYKVVLTEDDIVSTDKLNSIILEFTNIWTASGAPPEAALFDLNDFSVPGDICYFSPEAARIAMPLLQRYGGVPCGSPARFEVGALVAAANGASVPFHALTSRIWLAIAEAVEALQRRKAPAGDRIGKLAGLP